jgi:hypothetical protein
MSSLVKGVAVIFGFKGGVNFVVGAAAALRNLFNESGEFSHDFQVDRVQDEDNEYRSLIGSGELFKAKLLFTPRAVAGTNTLANAAASLTPPDMLSTVILGAAAGTGAVDFKLSLANASTWVYVGGWRVAFKKNGVATYELEIERSANNDLSAAVT